MARALVTGANGFVGAAVCRHLLARGWAVRGSVRQRDAALPSGVEAVVTGAIDAKTGVGHFVFLSSIGAAVAEADPAAANPYQISKLEAEAALRQATRDSGMVLILLRPPLIYGPGAPGNFRRFARLIARGRPLPLAAIDNRRSLLFIGNLATAVEAALACGTTPAAALALADAEDLSTAELARRIAQACGRPARLLPFPPALLRLVGRLLGIGPAVAALTGTLTIDNAEIHKTLGWSPDFSVDEGLAMTFRQQGQGQST